MRQMLLMCAVLICTTQLLGQATRPTTKPSTTPALPANVQSLLDEVGRAYASVKSLDLKGSISFEFQSDAESKTHSVPFTASYRAPLQFRHETVDDALVISTGVRAFAYLPAKNEYLACDAPKAKEEVKELPAPLIKVLRDQDPALLLAISPDAGKQLIAGATGISRLPDVQIGQRTYAAIGFARDKADCQVLIDPTTHFLRQIRIDQKKLFEQRGRDDVKAALYTVDYSRASTEASVGDALYTWSPPKDATVLKEAGDDSSEPGEAATALLGKAAPDFSLNGLDGKPVALVDLKGSVVVLDFWATWCGPCVASLPFLDKLAKEKGPDGLKLYAINLQEPKEKVQSFLESKQLTLPVLLDGKGDVAKKYSVAGIPQTVVIGKDGLVKKVIVGFGGDDTDLRAAVETAMQAQ